MKAIAVIEFRATGKYPRMSENCVVKYRMTPVKVGREVEGFVRGVHYIRSMVDVRTHNENEDPKQNDRRTEGLCKLGQVESAGRSTQRKQLNQRCIIQRYQRTEVGAHGELRTDTRTGSCETGTHVGKVGSLGRQMITGNVSLVLKYETEL